MKPFVDYFSIVLAIILKKSHVGQKTIITGFVIFFNVNISISEYVVEYTGFVQKMIRLLRIT